MRTLGRLLGWLGVVALLALAASIVALHLWGFRTYVVMSGSMGPALPVGSLSIVEPASPGAVRVGDVITFDLPDRTVTHRVIAVEQTPEGRVFSSKGDANAAIDLERFRLPDAVGLVRGHVALVGYVIFYVQSYWRLAAQAASVAVFIAAAVLLFAGGRPRSRAPQVARLPGLLKLAVAAVPLRSRADDELWGRHLKWVRTGASPLRQAA